MTSKATTILTSIVEEHEVRPNGIRVTSFSLSGEPEAAAIVNAVVAAYPRPEIDLEAQVASGKAKVTLITHGEGMLGAGSVVAEEVTLFAGSRGVGYLPKGARSKGFLVRPERVLDVIEGWKLAEAVKRVEAVRARFPELRKLTAERLAELPLESDTCTLGVFGTWKSPDGLTSADSLWVIHSYDPESDIAEGVLFVRPESHGTSEYGSIYGRDLLRFGGEVVDFVPISFADAVKLTDGVYTGFEAVSA